LAEAAAVAAKATLCETCPAREEALNGPEETPVGRRRYVAARIVS